MLNRPVVMTGVLGAAVGVPYAISNAPESWPDWPAAPAVSAPAEPAEQQAAAPQPLPTTGLDLPNSQIYRSPAPLEGARFHSLGQVFNFNVSKAWVYRNWARKSTGLADPELFGVRVPLVTGTGMADLAGSLSYYFNGAGQVERIRFRGTTADTRAIISLAQQHYGLTWQTPRVPGEQLLQARSGNNVVSQLRTFPEPVLWSTRPHGSFGVELELNRAESGRYVQDFGPKLVVPEPNQVAAAPSETAVEPSTDSEPAVVQSPGPELQNAKRPDFRWPN